MTAFVFDDGVISYTRLEWSVGLEWSRRSNHACAIVTAGRTQRVQYAYIEEPKIDQTSLHQPKAPLA